MSDNVISLADRGSRLKYCEDCKWSRPDSFSWRCAEPRADSGNLIARSEAKAFCSIARVDWTHIESCGTSAKWFVPKPPAPIEQEELPKNEPLAPPALKVPFWRKWLP